MSEKIIHLNEEVIKGEIKELVRESVEKTLNELLETEAEKLTQTARYERSEQRQGYCNGHYSRNLTTTSEDISLKVMRFKGVTFETAIIERCRQRESSVKETLIEMFLSRVSVRRVEDITEALWGSKVSPATISELNKKACVHIEDYRNWSLQGGRYPYVCVDGIYLRQDWGGLYWWQLQRIRTPRRQRTFPTVSQSFPHRCSFPRRRVQLHPNRETPGCTHGQAGGMSGR